MPLTAAEKMRRRRLKLKEEGKYEEYNRQIKEKMRNVREKKKQELQKLGKNRREKLLIEERKKVRERVSKCRRLKKEKKAAGSPVGYKNSSSLGKAVARVRKALPKSPRKRKSVVKKLFSSVVGSPATSNQSGHDKSVNPNDNQHKSNSLALSTEIIESVKAFYVREDISRQTPGIKDVISLRNSEGKKEKVQIRYLCYSILEAHALFKTETGFEIGKSKFAELRPNYVKLSNKLPHNVCLCVYHENFMMAVAALHKVVSTFPKYSFKFCEMFMCIPAVQKCWLGECEKCKSLFLTKMQEEVDGEACYENETSWMMWKEVDGSLTKVVHEGSVAELITYLDEISRKFFVHVCAKREQAASYNKQREEAAQQNFDPTLALIQFDFSENYTCIAQDEIQSYHWGQPQVSLFTCSIWFGGKQHPYVVVSDNITHSKDTVLAYVSRILDELPKGITEVRIWSDGPSSQFKNRFIAAALKTLQKNKDKKIVWNYFATSHGKGPVDGIGGAIKRAVRQQVLTKKCLVFNAQQFCDAAWVASEVKVILMNDQQILEINKNLNLKSVFKTAPEVKGISKIHAMELTAKNELKTYFLTKEMVNLRELELQKRKSQSKTRSIYSLVYSSDSESDNEDIVIQQQERSEVKKDDIKQGTFVKVAFDHENCSKVYTYVAICQTSVDCELDVRILCLNKVANSCRLFRVNTEEAEPYIKLRQILEILPTPEIEVHGERMYYSFEKEIEVDEK